MGIPTLMQTSLWLRWTSSRLGLSKSRPASDGIRRRRFLLWVGEGERCSIGELNPEKACISKSRASLRDFCSERAFGNSFNSDGAANSSEEQWSTARDQAHGPDHPDNDCLGIQVLNSFDGIRQDLSCSF
jgi:hypothetical protein